MRPRCPPRWLLWSCSLGLALAGATAHSGSVDRLRGTTSPEPPPEPGLKQTLEYRPGPVAGAAAAAERGRLFEAMGVLAPGRRTPAPDFSLPSLRGESLSLASFRGKVVLVNFWATWCPPCVAEMPSLEKLRGRFRGRPFEVVGISIDRQGEEVVRPFVRKLGVSFPLLLDPDQAVFRRFGGRGLPVSVLIGREGEVIGRVSGPREWASPEAEALVESLLAPLRPPRGKGPGESGILSRDGFPSPFSLAPRGRFPMDAPGVGPPEVALDGENLTIEQVEAVARRGARVRIAPEALARMEEAHALVQRLVEGGSTIYGVNTGFGSLSDVRVGRETLAELQLNLIRSHAAGVGEPLGEAEGRAVMLLRANVLAKGYSGVRPALAELLAGMLNAGLHPYIPSQGSVGASGDLAPLAHLALVLVGEGQVLRGGERVSGGEALRAAGLSPLRLGPKEGLSLINGTQVMTALGSLALASAGRLVRAADVIGALSLDALRGTPAAFAEEVQRLRPHPGALSSGRNLVRLIEGSAIRESHRHCPALQDCYSLRCMPQVHGAARQALGFARGVLGVEVNAATDNPLVFPESGEVLSGGNFHGQPVAVALDVLAVGLASLGTISERRTERLVNPAYSGLPPFLTRRSGLHSGYMLLQVTAAALASENKALCHPASVDTIPTSGGKEDHVSMGAHAARKAARVVENVRAILAVELLCAAQAVEFLRPLRSSEALERVHAALRERVPPLGEDRASGEDIAAAAELIESGAIARAAEAALGPLE